MYKYDEFLQRGFIICDHCHAKFHYVSELLFDEDECVSRCPECGEMIEEVEPEV